MATLSTEARNAAVDAVASGSFFRRLREGATALFSGGSPLFSAASGGSATSQSGGISTAFQAGTLDVGVFQDSGGTFDWITWSIGLVGSGADMECTGTDVAVGQRMVLESDWITLSMPES